MKPSDPTTEYEEKACEVALAVLGDLYPDERLPSLRRLRLSYRVEADRGTLTSLDAPLGDTDGEGIGGYMNEWTTVIVLNLVSAILFKVGERGLETLTNPETYSKLKRELLDSAKNARVMVQTAIDVARDRVVEAFGGSGKDAS